MKPPAFDYVAPTSLEEALSLVVEAGEDARVLAGGQSLIPLMALRLSLPSVLVDLNGVAELSAMHIDESGVTLGSMVRHRAVERSSALAGRAPLLHEAVGLIGHPAIRTRGTVGGSLAHADPAAELPAVALVTGATMTATSAAAGEREIAAEDFFQGYFTTALEPGEILTRVHFPAAGPRSGSSFQEVSRRLGDFAMVGVGATVGLDAGGNVADARVALINVADRPVLAGEAGRSLVGGPPDAAAFAQAADLAVRDLDPSDDLHASAAYRRKVAAVLVRRALETAAARAAASEDR